MSVYPSDIPAGLVKAKCASCQQVWWIEPPPTPTGTCMCCNGKLRFAIGRVDAGSQPDEVGMRRSGPTEIGENGCTTENRGVKP